MVVGAAVALLMAPSSGQELREQLQARAKGDAEEAVAEAIESEDEGAA